jgi:glutamate---cysteine ligase / carboxylate-amine ligase
VSGVPYPADLSPEALRAAFEPPSEMTVGIEEELMLVDARTFELAPRAHEVLAATGGDPRFKPELPAAQLEIAVPPAASVPEAAAGLHRARADIAAVAEPDARLAAAGAHPFSAPEGPVHPAPRYHRLEEEFGAVIRHQLLFGLHVHFAVRPAGRALAVYNALRSYLPDLAALAANAPFYEGRDSGLASVRPRISGLLPRQGIPPALDSFEAYAEALRWCGFDDPRQWWWELRLHPTFGTVEIRVPDTQATIADTAAVATVAHALATRVADDGVAPAESWRIDHNRWAACRHGAAAVMTDPATGERERTRDRLARALGTPPPALDGAARQRALAAEHGLDGLVAALADGFTA